MFRSNQRRWALKAGGRGLNVGHRTGPSSVSTQSAPFEIGLAHEHALALGGRRVGGDFKDQPSLGALRRTCWPHRDDRTAAQVLARDSAPGEPCEGNHGSDERERSYAARQRDSAWRDGPPMDA